MKNKIFNIILALLTLFISFSCSDDRDPVLEQSNAKAAQFKSAPSGTYIVTESNLQNVFETFVISPPSYNINTEYIYQLEAAKAGTNFENPVNLGSSTNSEFIKINYSGINTVALKLGATNLVPFTIDVRIKSNIKNTTDYLYSSASTFTVVPFVAGPLYPYKDLYLIGNATAATWDNNASNGNMYPLEKDKTNPNKYTYTGYFTSGGFKMVEVKGSWEKQYGKGSSDGVLSTSGGSSDISVSTAGYYKLSVDINALTYSFVPVSNPSMSFNMISIIGTVNGNWNTDTDLTQSPFDSHVWTAKNVTLASGVFKFRANYDWGNSWGEGQEFFGFGVNNGANIPLTTAWKYDVYFNDMTGAYTLIPIF